MRRIVVDAARYTSAYPNYSHRILAYLLLENHIQVITTNWDDCIERSTGVADSLAVIGSDMDYGQVKGNALLKIHGCATRPINYSHH